MELIGSNFKLRPWTMGDKESIVEQANNINVWKTLRDFFPHPYRLEDAETWIKDNITKEPTVSFVLEVDGKVAGSIGLTPQSDVYRKNIEIGYFLGEGYWNRGIMSEAIKIMTDYIFSNFDVVRVYASVFEANPASARVLEKAGYKLEGVFPKGIYKQGKYLDEYIYGLGKPD